MGNLLQILTPFTVGYIVFQIAIFVMMYIFYKRETSLDLQTLKDVKAKIEKLDEKDITNRNLNEIFGEQPKQSKFVQQWKRYYNSISQKESHEKINVKPFFSVETLDRILNSNKTLSMGAGIHTSLGVIGTFIGLTMGLLNLNLDSANELQLGIGALLEGMSTAFSTSMIGIAFSIWWMIIERRGTTRFEKLIDWHSNQLIAALDADDEELWLQRLQEVSKQQADHFATVLTDLFESQFTPFSEQLFHNFTRMSEQMDRQSDLTTEQIELTRNQGTDLSATLIDSLQSSQESFVEKLTANVEMMTSRFGELSSQLEQASQTYLEANHKNIELLHQTEEVVEKIEPMTEHMESVVTMLKESQEQLDTLQIRQAELIPHLQEWNDEVLTYLKDFTKLSERQLGEVTQQVAYGKEQWEVTAQSFEETRKQLDESMNHFASGIEKGLTTTFQQFEKELLNVVQHFKSLSGTYVESQEALTNVMHDTVERLQNIEGKEL